MEENEDDFTSPSQPNPAKEMRMILPHLRTKVEEFKGASSAATSTPAAKGIIIWEKRLRDEAPDVTSDKMGSKEKETSHHLRPRRRPSPRPAKWQSWKQLGQWPQGRATRPILLLATLRGRWPSLKSRISKPSKN